LRGKIRTRTSQADGLAGESAVRAIGEVTKTVAAGGSDPVHWITTQANGIDPRPKVRGDKKPNVSPAVATCDVCTEGVADPSIGPRTAEHLSDERQWAFTDELIGTINTTRAVKRDVLADVGKLRLMTGAFRELRQEIMESDLGNAAEVTVRQTESDNGAWIILGSTGDWRTECDGG
jgi:hypothetical protein